jgi:hypothetical protein
MNRLTYELQSDDCRADLCRRILMALRAMRQLREAGGGGRGVALYLTVI